MPLGSWNNQRDLILQLHLLGYRQDWQMRVTSFSASLVPSLSNLQAITTFGRLKVSSEMLTP